MIDYVSNICTYIYDYVYISLHFMMIIGKNQHKMRRMDI